MFAERLSRVIHRFIAIAIISAAIVSMVHADNSLAPTAEPNGDLVLVAGATGRTGSHVVSELLANGYRVRAFVRDAESAREKLGDEIEYAVGDVRQRETIDAALYGATAVISAIGAGREDPVTGRAFPRLGVFVKTIPSSPRMTSSGPSP